MIFLNPKFYNDFCIVTGLVLLLGCSACGKKQNHESLGQTYFKMSFLEMSDDADSAGGKRALALVDKAIVCEQRPEYYAFKATVLFSLEQYNQSEQAFKKALALEQDKSLRAEIMNNYACLLAQKRDYSGAKKIWKGLKISPAYQTPEVALVNLGKLYMRENHFDKAKKVFGRAAYLCPSYIDAHFYLAYVAGRLGDDALMRQERNIVLQLEPEHQGAMRL